MRTAALLAAGIRSCVLLGMLAPAGCGSMSPEVAADALAYHETADVTANRIILLNVLRARDNAPLHFGELSLQHGQVSEQAGVIFTQPIGEIPKSTSLPRASIAPAVTVGDQVAFDLGTLDTQNFTQGVTSPIAPKMLKYFLDSGIDHRLVVMLLVSGVRLPGGQEAIANFPRSEREVCYPDGFPKPGTMPARYEMHARSEDFSDCKNHEWEFFAALRVLNGLRRIYAVSYRPFIPIGAPFLPDVARSLHDLLALDPAKQGVRPAPGGRLQLGLLTPEDKIVLCEEAPASTAGRNAAAPGVTAHGTTHGAAHGANHGATQGTTPADIATTPAEICGATNASVVVTDDDQQSATSTAPSFDLRSTLGIFSFLGQVLGSQEDRSRPGKDVCIRLDAPPAGSTALECDKGQVLFHLTGDRAAARFGVDYDGRYWGVPNPAPCVNPAKFCDHTLETMSILSLLLNLNKSARDIPSTPAVQVVP